ncbi:hypothetical protein ZWY2020_050109 [Hordeum vulgare]|nr:hypothetical protein ZWY2020_050109 [Hordeum vulgare]
MALLFPSSTSRQDLSPPADSLPPTSQGGSSNGPKADVGRKKEVDHLLAKLEKEGVEIDDKITSIIDDEIARIKAEAERENINEQKRKRIQALLTIAGVAVGFVVGVKCEIDKYRKAFAKIYGRPIRAASRPSICLPTYLCWDTNTRVVSRLFEAGSSNGPKADVVRNKEVDHLLAKLEKEGVEIDGKIASIIDVEIARIKAEAERENIINELKRNGRLAMLTISSLALGFFLGGELFEKALYAQLRVIFGED